MRHSYLLYMKAFVINLPHRTDRIEQLSIPKEIVETYELFPATDGSSFAFEKSKRIRGHMGCWDSHRRLMETIKDAGNGATLVLEDDCIFIKDADLQKYLNELPKDWDMLYLGGINQDAPESFSEHLDYAKNILQTHAYIIRDTFIPTLLQVLTNHRWKVDIVFSEAIKRGKCFICNPPIALQSDSKSDINNNS